MEEDIPDTSDLRLTMEVNSGPRCFDLNDQERLMEPDDWAWRFLRLNQKYQLAYRQAIDRRLLLAMQGKPSERILIHRPSDLHRMVVIDENICRKDFGLSTWLDPETVSLPTLSNGESWFSPLTSVTAEPRFDALKAEKFGYDVLHKYLEPESGEEATVQLSGQACSSARSRRTPWMSGSVWFAIDCSIPPEGQINSIRAIAEKFTTEMRKGKLSSSAFVQEDFRIKRVDPSNGWAPTLPLPTAVHDRETDAMEMWRLVKVSLVGPVQTQLDKCRAELIQVHESLVKDKPWRKYFQERFRPNLSGNDEGVGKDGSTLKAYLTMAEFNHPRATDSKSIIETLAKMGAGKDLPPRDKKRPSNPWLDGIEQRAVLFDNHAKRGKEYVDGGYKWLIHSQNPPHIKARV